MKPIILHPASAAVGVALAELFLGAGCSALKHDPYRGLTSQSLAEPVRLHSLLVFASEQQDVVSKALGRPGLSVHRASNGGASREAVLRDASERDIEGVLFFSITEQNTREVPQRPLFLTVTSPVAPRVFVSNAVQVADSKRKEYSYVYEAELMDGQGRRLWQASGVTGWSIVPYGLLPHTAGMISSKLKKDGFIP